MCPLLLEACAHIPNPHTLSHSCHQPEPDHPGSGLSGCPAPGGPHTLQLGQGRAALDLPREPETSGEGWAQLVEGGSGFPGTEHNREALTGHRTVAKAHACC